MISVLQLGRVDYESALRLQRTLVEMRHAGRVSDVLLLLEHPPVITLGRNAKERNVLASREQLAARGVEVFECDRGGDVTFHGPGQLVGYPIINLRELTGPEGQRKTLGAVDYVRRMEEALIRTCTDFGIACRRISGLTGVWTAPASGEPAKIAAIGVHISRGITSHGFALNVNTELEYFGLIVPCGISARPVTSIAHELGHDVGMQTVAEGVARNFGRVFDCQVLWAQTLEQLLGEPEDTPARAPRELREMTGEDELLLA